MEKKLYQAFVDVSHTWEDHDIEVLSFVAEGVDAEDAQRNLSEELNSGLKEEVGAREWFLWDITEDDKITEVIR